MNVFVVGCKGMLGTDMMLVGSQAGHSMQGADFPAIDITDQTSVDSVIDSAAPDIIINCAAYTAVDACEDHQAQAFAVNRDGVANLARCAERRKALLVHISTDYVFNGLQKTPYLETDQPDPKTVYGSSKLAGEEQVLSLCRRHFIFRIAWLYGLYGANFVKTIRTLALQRSQNGAPLKVVNDQYGTPTYTRQVCRQIIRLFDCTDYGIYHSTQEGACTWYDFARLIVEKSGIACTVAPCSTQEFVRPAQRPASSVLENGRLKKHALNSMAPWQEAFEEFLRDEHQAVVSGV